MPRRLRVSCGGYIYHVCNRAVGRARLFRKTADYEAFEHVLAQAKARLPMRVLAWCVLPTHWHLLLWPRGDTDLSEFMRWLTVTHTQRWHAAHGTAGAGPLYQGRFKSFPIQADDHLLTALHFVERHPLRAGLVKKVAAWQWSSLWCRLQGDEAAILDESPVPLPRGWRQRVQASETEAGLLAVRHSLVRGAPFGEPAWERRTAKRLSLESSLRPRGRPQKQA